jgi:hypothetical protein
MPQYAAANGLCMRRGQSGYSVAARRLTATPLTARAGYPSDFNHVKGDTNLVHVNKAERDLLDALPNDDTVHQLVAMLGTSGGGSINPDTGLEAFDGPGDGPGDSDGASGGDPGGGGDDPDADDGDPGGEGGGGVGDGVGTEAGANNATDSMSQAEETAMITGRDVSSRSSIGDFGRGLAEGLLGISISPDTVGRIGPASNIGFGLGTATSFGISPVGTMASLAARGIGRANTPSIAANSEPSTEVATDTSTSIADTASDLSVGSNVDTPDGQDSALGGPVAISGSNIGGTFDASVAADAVPLHTSGTAGQLQDETSTGTKVSGIVNVAATGTSVGTNIEVIMKAVHAN